MYFDHLEDNQFAFFYSSGKQTNHQKGIKHSLIAKHSGFIKYSLNKPDEII